MRRDLITPLANIPFDNKLGVDGVSLVRVDDNTEKTRVWKRKYFNIINRK